MPKTTTTESSRYIKLTHKECEKVKDILNDYLQQMFKISDQTDEALNNIEDLIELRSKFRRFSATLG